MASLCLNLTLERKGTSGTLDDALNAMRGDLAHTREIPGELFVTAMVEDPAEFFSVMTATNLALIDWIRIQKPDSVYAMARELSKDPSNLLKTLRELAAFHLVRLEEGMSVRKVVRPRVEWTELKICLPEDAYSQKKSA